MILPDHILEELLGLKPRTNPLIKGPTLNQIISMSHEEIERARDRANGMVLRMDPEPEAEAIQPASVDMRLDLSGGVWRLEKPDTFTETVFGPDERILPNYQHDPCPGGRLVLKPGDCVLATTLEVVSLGSMFSAQVSGKSSIGRLFVPIHITAGFIDPGFTGQITLEIHNASKRKVTFLDKTYVCQLVVSMLLEPAKLPYGAPGRRSRYLNQRGATVPKK